LSTYLTGRVDEQLIREVKDLIAREDRQALKTRIDPIFAADLVKDLPAERARQIIDSVPDDVSEDLEKLLSHPEDTAGGIMGLEFVSVWSVSRWWTNATDWWAVSPMTTLSMSWKRRRTKTYRS
jgi:Mg/Co/Ni transporter MgtE